MKILSIELENFLSYKKETFFFPEGLTAISGENGSGKTSLFEAVDWCITSNSNRGKKNSSIIKHNEKTAKVVLNAMIGDKEYEISRTVSLSKNSSKSKMRIKDIEKDEYVSDGVTQSQKFLEELNNGIPVGIIRDIYRMDQSVSSGGNAFTTASGQERCDMLIGITPDLYIWEEKHKKAKQELKNIEKEIIKKETEIEISRRQIIQASGFETLENSELPDLTSEKIQGEIGNLKNKSLKIFNEIKNSISDQEILESRNPIETLNFKISELRAKKDFIKNNIKNENLVPQQIEQTQRNLEQINANLENSLNAKKEKEENVEQDKKDVQNIEKKIDEKEQILENKELNVSSLKKELSIEKKKKNEKEIKLKEQSISKKIKEQELNNLSKMINSGKCDFCEQEITQEYAKLKQEQQQEEQKRINVQLKEFKEKIIEIEEKIKESEKEINRIEKESEKEKEIIFNLEIEINSLEQELHIKKENISSFDLSNVEKEISHWDKEQKENEKQLISLKEKRIKPTEENDKELNKISSREAHYLELKGKIEPKIEERKKLIVEIKTKYNLLTENFNNQKQQNKELIELKQKSKIISSIIEATHKMKIPLFLIEETLDELQEEQNQIISKFSDSMRVVYSMSKPNSKEEKPSIEIFVEGVGENPILFENLSFGERVRITISNMIAMIRLFNRKSTNPIKTIFLDEPMGPLDENAIMSFLNIIKEAINNNDIESVLLVTHDPRIQSSLENKIKITKKENEGSKITNERL